MGWSRRSPLAGLLPAWRRDDDLGLPALCITARGRAAVGIDDAEALPDAQPLSGMTVEDGDATPDAPSQRTRNSHKAASNRSAAARRKRSSDETRQQSTKPGPRVSKQSRVIEMLHRGQGSTIAAIVKATSWRPHSVRGLFAGVVRKKLGLRLVSEKTGTDRTQGQGAPQGGTTGVRDRAPGRQNDRGAQLMTVKWRTEGAKRLH